MNRRRVAAVVGLVVVWAFLLLLVNRSGGPADDEDEPDGGEPQVVKPEEAREAVMRMTREAWSAYRRHAWGFDELKPISRRGHNFLFFGATIVDSLDALWIMDLKPEYEEARKWVSTFDFGRGSSGVGGQYVSLFETTIRVLGGLLGAFEVSQDRMYLEKATQLADALLPALTKSRSGIPLPSVNVVTKSAVGGQTCIAEAGSLQMEFAYLSHHTGDKRYADLSLRALAVMNASKKVIPGLYHTSLSVEDGTSYIYSTLTMGGMSDSFYEYLVKLWLLMGGEKGRSKDPDVVKYRRMFDESLEAITKHLLVRSPTTKLVYLSDLRHPFKGQSSRTDRMEHLACFAGGMYVLAGGKNNLQHAKDLGLTCWEGYQRTQTGLGPESMTLHDGTPKVDNPTYLLRPEAVETWLYLYRATHDNKYRRWGWQVIKALQKHCRMPDGDGYSALEDVNNGRRSDIQPSFFIAETLKYLFLLFSPDDLLPLSDFVFTTEAHPLGVFN